MRTKEIKSKKVRRVVLSIKDSEYPFFMELVKNLRFVQVVEDSGDTKEAIKANLTQGFKELELYKQGKLETTPAKDFLNEL